VKRCATKLGDKHLRQVQSYAVNEGVEWVWLTNGQLWQVWHLTGGLPVVMDLAIEVDLLDQTTTQAKCDQLFDLT
jgi:predicted type IV restriction endonuclease